MAHLPKNTTDSHAPLVFEIQFNNGRGDGNKNILPYEYLQSLEFDLLGTRGWTGQVVFFDRMGGYLENLILSSGKQRTLQVRFGWDNTGGLNRQPIWVGTVVTYTPALSTEGVTLTINLTDTVIGGCVPDKKIRSFPEKKKASDIFKEIAKDRKWAIVDEAGNQTVEDSTFEIPTPLSTDNESDIKFIREQLLKHASNTRGNAFVFYVDRDNTAHFHSRDYLLETGSRSRQTAAEYIFARDQMGEVISFEPTENVFEAILTGGGNAEISGVDSSNGTVVKKEAKAEKGPDGVTLSLKNGAAFTTDKPEGIHNRSNIIARTPEELDSVFKSRWTELQRMSYPADMVVRGTHAVQIADYINVQWIRADGRSHYLSGTFHVLGIKHSVDSSGWRTQFSLIREGSQRTQYSKQLEGQPVTAKPGEITQEIPNVKAPNDGGSVQTSIVAKQGNAVGRRG